LNLGALALNARPLLAKAIADILTLEVILTLKARIADVETLARGEGHKEADYDQKGKKSFHLVTLEKLYNYWKICRLYSIMGLESEYKRRRKRN